jgi:hypothetical protein
MEFDDGPYWILDDDGNPVPVDDVLTWGEWFETSIERRRVAQDRDECQEGATREVRISTVFLGIDHAFGGGPPLLYETMVFGGPLDGFTARYHDRESALRGHQKVCRKVRLAIRGK